MGGEFLNPQGPFGPKEFILCRIVPEFIEKALPLEVEARHLFQNILPQLHHQPGADIDAGLVGIPNEVS